MLLRPDGGVLNLASQQVSFCGPLQALCTVISCSAILLTEILSVMGGGGEGGESARLLSAF